MGSIIERRAALVASCFRGAFPPVDSLGTGRVLVGGVSFSFSSFSTGIERRAALVANCLRGAFPAIDPCDSTGTCGDGAADAVNEGSGTENGTKS